MARQISGQYKVRSRDLKPLYEKARAMIAQMESFSIRHVYREQNREADRLANEAMDHAERGIAAAPPARHSPSPPAPERSTPHNASAALPPNPDAVAIQNGVFRPHKQIALFDDEEVELKIHRKR
jgi:hypothetical protein